MKDALLEIIKKIDPNIIFIIVTVLYTLYKLAELSYDKNSKSNCGTNKTCEYKKENNKSLSSISLNINQNLNNCDTNYKKTYEYYDQREELMK
jgi:hypothetical protein